MAEAGSLVLADLGGIVGASEEWTEMTVRTLEHGKMFCDEGGMVKTAGANMTTNGGERDKIGLISSVREGVVYNFS